MENGLAKPQQYEDKPQLGKVIKVGDRRLQEDGTIIPLKVKLKDIVLFNKYSTTEFSLSNIEYLILREEDVIGIYRK